MSQNNDDDRTAVDEKPSLFIRILFCQNASWQGEIQWMEGRQTRRFRSALELLLLIQEAVELSGKPPSSYEFRGWEANERGGSHSK